ncbi:MULTISPECIES: hypothetical protein [unclassified Thermoactinomyces]|uniref:hypothetical protein n=1 Tax=unclassified Thermoactinomyces TaxID=2634588 RepID=UPI000B2DC0B7|nr:MULTISPECIES: hypothetical protein [unclassified Thermoactinomyces]MBI0386680.1 hypothetical protein [Thermoactinomyces sp. CICC 24227]
MKQSASNEKRIRFIYAIPDRSITREEKTRAAEAKERVIQGLIEWGMDGFKTCQRGERG